MWGETMTQTADMIDPELESPTSKSSTDPQACPLCLAPCKESYPWKGGLMVDTPTLTDTVALHPCNA